ncbi:MAG: hypothetical protein B6D34_05720 [Candidatus Brocadia sp. UTAMX1]|nr:MAG: hypothetical protein B6D34_05720 [Candidatus Brocadia sp. UTAMX1]
MDITDKHLCGHNLLLSRKIYCFFEDKRYNGNLSDIVTIWPYEKGSIVPCNQSLRKASSWAQSYDKPSVLRMLFRVDCIERYEYSKNQIVAKYLIPIKTEKNITP